MLEFCHFSNTVGEFMPQLKTMLIGCVGLFAFLNGCTTTGADSKRSSYPISIRDGVTLHHEVLPNGLNVFLVHNESAPTTSVSHWVRVGSLHETPGITGIAHLFEHMMFRPLKVGEPNFFSLASTLGGEVNAHTRFDGTLYESVIPTQNLKKFLLAESNRFKLMHVTNELLDTERKAVWSEYSTKFDANSTISMWDTIYRKAFPNHPLGWHIIGDRGDLEKIHADDCNKFFSKYYKASNTAIFISGAIDIQQTLTWVKEMYSDWAAGEEASFPPSPTVGTNPVFGESPVPSQNPNYLVGFRTPNLTEKNYQAIFLTNHILFESENSLAKKSLVRELKLASEAVAFNFQYDSNMMKLLVFPSRETNYSAVLGAVVGLNQKLSELSDDEFTAYKKEYEILSAENLLRNASLASALTYAWGELRNEKLALNWATKELDVSLKDVRHFAAQYISTSNGIVIRPKKD